MDGIVRASNWYCNEINQRLRIEEVIPPELKRDMAPMLLGYFGVELPMEISPLTSEMTVNGIHADLKNRFGREPGDWTTISYYESLLNVFPSNSTGNIGHNGGPALRGRTLFLKGLLNHYGQGGQKHMKPSGPVKLTWSTIVLYHDIIDGVTVHKFDLQNNILIIDGVNYTANSNQLIAA